MLSLINCDFYQEKYFWLNSCKRISLNIEEYANTGMYYHCQLLKIISIIILALITWRKNMTLKVKRTFLKCVKLYFLFLKNGRTMPYILIFTALLKTDLK